MEYYRVEYNTKELKLKRPEIDLYPLVCMHLGARQCAIKFLKGHLREIAENPNARWVYLGDGGECSTKISKGDVYTQLLGPQEQQDAIVKLLEPIKDKGIAGFQGNHGRRIDKESGLSFDKTLCLRLGIPYLGISAMVNLVVNRSSYDLFFHHGADSGTATRAKVDAAEKFGKFIDADALFTAHSHVAMDLPPAAIMSADNIGKKVKTKLRHQYICGSAYDSRSGYAEEKGYPPILPSYIKVIFDGRIIEGKSVKDQKCEILRAGGDYEPAEFEVYQGLLRRRR